MICDEWMNWDKWMTCDEWMTCDKWTARDDWLNCGEWGHVMGECLVLSGCIGMNGSRITGGRKQF